MQINRSFPGTPERSVDSWTEKAASDSYSILDGIVDQKKHLDEW